jgi:hypothetical protein
MAIRICIRCPYAVWEEAMPRPSNGGTDDLAVLRAELDALRDAAAVEQLVFEYYLCDDTPDFARQADMFVSPHGAFRAYAAGTLIAEATGRDAIHELLNRAVIFDDGTPRVHHVVSNMKVDIEESGASASARYYVTVLQAAPDFPLQPIGCAVFHDRFEKVNDTWYFTEHSVETQLIGDMRYHVDEHLLARQRRSMHPSSEDSPPKPKDAHQ